MGCFKYISKSKSLLAFSSPRFFFSSVTVSSTLIKPLYSVLPFSVGSHAPTGLVFKDQERLQNRTFSPRCRSTNGKVDGDLSHSFLDPVLRSPAVDMVRFHQLIDSFFHHS